MTDSYDWLVFRLRAPMMSFGGTVIDHVGPTSRWPGVSLITGLIGNALGWDWTDRSTHQALQDRIVLAAAEIRAGDTLIDVQNVQIKKSDKGWTTRGVPEGRGGDSYGGPHRRHRTYLTDAEYISVLRLMGNDGPTLSDVSDAVQRPARPLFIGRKPCLPSGPILRGPVRGDTAHAALSAAVGKEAPGQVGHKKVLASWPVGEGPNGRRHMDMADLRVWTSGLAAGTRRIVEGHL